MGPDVMIENQRSNGLGRFLTVAFLAAFMGAGAAAAADKDIRVSTPSEHRVALVIGNASYPNAPLKNPVNDAHAMTETLRAVGFDVIEKVNANKAQMEDAVIAFGKKLGDGAIGLVYYSGHGIQVAGKNYLVPVDADIESEQAVPLRTIDADTVIDQMMSAKTRVNLIILDACRNNPFERRFRALAGAGLAQMNAPEGTLVAYATAPGKVASDGSGSNGLYTQELLKAMNEPGLPVEQVFKRVRATVTQASQGGQVPWESSSLIGEFYFRDGPANQQPAPAVLAPPPAPTVAQKKPAPVDQPKDSVVRHIPSY
jgi:uncharacterized caspase-like protein